MKNGDIIKEILKTYKLDNPIPPEAKQAMLRARKDVLIAILKKHGKYSLLIMLMVLFFFWVKKLGIGITVFKSWLIIGTVSVITGGAVTVGAVYTVKKVVFDKKPIEKKQELQDTTQSNDTGIKQQPGRKEVMPAINYAVSIKNFSKSVQDKDVSSIIQQKIFNKLVQLKGNNIISPAYSSKTAQVVTGSIVQLGTSYLVSVKLLDQATMKIIFSSSETAKSKEDIDRVTQSMAVKLAGKI